jgi:hypothetical protein
MLLLGVLAVSCTGGGNDPPPPPEPSGPAPTAPSLLQADQPWIVNARIPQTAVLGEEFEMSVTLVNRSDADQVLESVHFSEEYFQGVEILRTSPSTESRDSHLGPGIREFPLGTAVPAKKQAGLVLFVRAVKEGTYPPDLTVCVTHPQSPWVERYREVCAGHEDVAEGMATNWQPLGHGLRSTRIEAKGE